MMSLSPVLNSTNKMEFYFTMCPFLEKVAESPMEAVLSNIQPNPPRNWLRLIRQHDPNGQYVVIAMSHFKERSTWPDLQHEFLLLFVQLRPPPNQLAPTAAPIAIKVSRTIFDHAILAQLGLWGPAVDTVHPTTSTQTEGAERLQHFTWVPHGAPSLANISLIVFLVQKTMPHYRLFTSSCYAFTRAVGRSIDLIFNGNMIGAGHLPFMIRETYFLHCIPAGIAKAESVAAEVAQDYQALQ